MTKEEARATIDLMLDGLLEFNKKQYWDAVKVLNDE